MRPPIHPFIHQYDDGGAGAHSSCHWLRGASHIGQVATSSPTEANSQPYTATSSKLCLLPHQMCCTQVHLQRVSVGAWGEMSTVCQRASLAAPVGSVGVCGSLFLFGMPFYSLTIFFVRYRYFLKKTNIYLLILSYMNTPLLRSLSFLPVNSSMAPQEPGLWGIK